MDNIPSHRGYVDNVLIEDDIRTIAVFRALCGPPTFLGGSTLSRNQSDTSSRVLLSETSFENWTKYGIEPQSTDVSVDAYSYAQQFASNDGGFFAILHGPADREDRVTSFFVEDATALAILQRTNKLARQLIEDYPKFLPEITLITPALCHELGLEPHDHTWPEIRVSHETFEEMKRDTFRINDFIKVYGSDFALLSQQFYAPLMEIDAEPISAETFIRYAKKIMNAEPEIRELLHGAFERIELRAASMGHNPFTYTYVKGRCYTASDLARLNNHGNSLPIAELYDSIFMSRMAEGNRVVASAQLAVLAAWDLMMVEHPDFPEDQQKLLIADAYQRAEDQILSHFGGKRDPETGAFIAPYQLDELDINYTHVEAMRILSELRPDLYQPVDVPRKRLPGLDLS